ncbi:MAG: hypothetical protein WDW38_000317 [Sanguina aurantia]
MARNAEKAQAPLNRLLQHKQNEERGPRQKRPFLATEVSHHERQGRPWLSVPCRSVGLDVFEDTPERGLDEEDGVLVRVEAEAEALMRAEAMLLWEEKEHEVCACVRACYTAYVPLPDQRAIELRVLEKKKADLMSKYTSESLLQEQSDAKSLLNKK